MFSLTQRFRVFIISFPGGGVPWREWEVRGQLEGAGSPLPSCQGAGEVA